MLRIWRVILLACIGALVLSGCAARVPTHPVVSDEESLRVIADRLAAVRTMSASASISLTGPDGGSVSLDGAFVAAPPERARLRAWKFGTPVLDLTILPEGVWVFVAEREHNAAEGGDLGKLPAASIARALELKSAEYFRKARPLPEESNARTLVAIGPAAGREDVRCEIDRSTLTPRRFLLAPEVEAGELTMDRYTMVNDIPWPRTLRFRGREGEVQVQMEDIELNTDIPDSAFTPPARATRLP